MSTQYHVFQNNGAGGPVDYSVIVGTTASLSFPIGPLAAPGRYAFAVRAFESATGVEEKNVDAVVELVLNASGQDVSARPYAPEGVSAVAIAAGGARVSWSYPHTVDRNRPTGFHVYRGTSTVSYAAPVGTVSYLPGWTSYRFDDSGLTDGVTYRYGVRAYNTTAEEPNTVAVSVVADTSPPSAVENLTSSSV